MSPFERAMLQAMREDATLAALGVIARRIRVTEIARVEVLDGVFENQSVDSHDTTIGEFIADNADGWDGEDADLTELEVGEYYDCGGGASARHRITRLPDVEVRS